MKKEEKIRKKAINYRLLNLLFKILKISRRGWHCLLYSAQHPPWGSGAGVSNRRSAVSEAGSTPVNP